MTHGVLTLADEVLTSDSSRYWDAAAWRDRHDARRADGELRQADRARLARRELGQAGHAARTARRDRRAHRGPLPRAARTAHRPSREGAAVRRAQRTPRYRDGRTISRSARGARMPPWKLHGNGRTVEPGDGREARRAPELARDDRDRRSSTSIAMFGATFLVPVLTGFPVSTTLLFSGVGTILFLLITRNKLPSYLGSSFAFIAPVTAATAIAGHGLGARRHRRGRRAARGRRLRRAVRRHRLDRQAHAAGRRRRDRRPHRVQPRAGRVDELPARSR